MDSDPVIKQVKIIRVKNSKFIQMEDAIIDEEVLSIDANGKNAFKMVCSMTDVPDLAAGFLFTQGIVRAQDEINKIEWIQDKKTCSIKLEKNAAERLDQVKETGMIKGSSGGSLLQSDPDKTDVSRDDFSITPEQVMNLIDSHWKFSKRFHQTGALHSAGLCDTEGTLSYFEDIGRHNAVDKLAGSILMNDIDITDKIATVSCRMSLEIVGKIIQTGVPILISNAAPTLSAVKLADKAGLTIIGFARNKRFNIYTHGHRIKPI